MPTRWILPLLLACFTFAAAPRANAGLDVDFRLELGWRASYHHDFDAAVILYEYTGYRGRRMVLYPGEQLPDFYDYEWGFRVRSVEVIGPVHVVLFDESGLWGHQLTLYSSAHDLGDFRMRLNDYSTFRWHRRARSAYVSFNQPGVEVSIHVGRRIYPRVFCARPIVPVYFAPWRHHNYHYPRPHWRRDYWRHRAPVPPPNTRPYRPSDGPIIGRPPPRGVGNPPSRPPSRGAPPLRPPSPPPGHGPGGPDSGPGGVPGAPDFRPGDAPGGSPPPRIRDERPDREPPRAAPPNRVTPDREPARATPRTMPPNRSEEQVKRSGPPSAPPSRAQPDRQPPRGVPARPEARPTPSPRMNPPERLQPAERTRVAPAPRSAPPQPSVRPAERSSNPVPRMTPSRSYRPPSSAPSTRPARPARPSSPGPPPRPRDR